MRQAEGRKLARYLVFGWAIGVLALVGMLYSTHQSLRHDDWTVVAGTASVMGGVFWHIYDVWRRGESRDAEHRKGTSTRAQP